MSGVSAVEGIGVDQTYQDMITVRLINTTYTNTTGKAIVVHAELDGVTYGHALILTVGGVQVVGNPVSVDGWKSLVTAIVAVGDTYILSVTSGGTVLKWKELR